MLNELYDLVRLRSNFFLPSMKLLEKWREGSQVKKRYDTPKTPYQRVLDSQDVSPSAKARLTRQYKKLNPAKIERRIQTITRRLEKLIRRTQTMRRESREQVEEPNRPSSEADMAYPEEATKHPGKEIPFRKNLDEATNTPFEKIFY